MDFYIAIFPKIKVNISNNSFAYFAAWRLRERKSQKFFPQRHRDAETTENAKLLFVIFPRIPKLFDS